MASRSSKFRPGILVSNVAVLAVFIFLSAPTTAEEPTRCYWCGPLAEQVHRSQRAPSCEIFDLEQHETVCDKGYTHCAIIAASPPYSESRLCVKFYQDECYSLYCNSTKTWRTVCACRGDLCNGPHTDRETEAFALVPRFLGQTKSRNKRSLISGFISVKTKAPSENNTIIIMNDKSYNDTKNILQSDQPVEQTENTTIGVINDTPKHIEENIIIEHGTFKNAEKSITHASPSKVESYDDSKMHNPPPTMPPMDDKHPEIVRIDKHLDNAEIDKHLDNAKTGKRLDNDKMEKHLDNASIDKHLDKAKTDEHIDNAEIDKHLDNAKSDNNLDTAKMDEHIDNAKPDNNLDYDKMDKHLDSAKINNVKTENSEINKQLDRPIMDNHLDNAKMDIPTTPVLEYTTPIQFIKETHGPDITAFASMKPTSIEIEVAVLHNSVTPGKLPPAEALQQNVTPTKAMELTTIGTVVMSTENNHIVETTPSIEINNLKKNCGAQICGHLILFVISFLFTIAFSN